MRDYAKVAPTFWTDHKGRRWRTPRIKGRLQFDIQCHAALRAFVFTRDGFRCQKCGISAVPPFGYDGREPVALARGWCLVADHIVSRRNGGSHHPDNLMTLCDSCNARKSGLIDAKGKVSCIGY